MSCTDCASNEIKYVGNGSLVLYTFPFTYFDQTDVYVELYNFTTRRWDVTTEWTFANATTVQFNTAPAAPPSTDPSYPNIRIARCTDIDPLAATFYPGSAIRAQDLNNNFEMLQMAIQEGRCKVPDWLFDYLDKYYWNKGEQTLKSGDAWISDDAHIATTAAGDARWLNDDVDIIGGDSITSTEQGYQVTLDIDLATNGGLESTNPGDPAGELRVDDGNGIVVNATGVNVGAGTGITVNADDVAVTSQTIWGQAHDHSAAVDGDMTNVGNVTFQTGGGTLDGVDDENIQIAAGGTGIFDVDRNTDIDGTLDVSGAVDFDSTLDVSGAVDFGSTLNVDGNTSFGNSGSNTHEFDGDVTILRLGDIRFNGEATSNAGSARFIAPNQFFDSGGTTPIDFSYTLPATAPPGTRVLQSDSSGVMSWAVGTGGGGGAIQNLSNTTTTTAVTVEISDGGNDTTIAAASDTQAGVMTSGMFDKLDGLPGSNTGVLNLEDLDDVAITTIADGQVIRWNDTDSRWVNETLFPGGTVLNFRGVVDMRTNNPTIAYGSINPGDFWVHDDPSEADPAAVVGTAQQDSTVPSGWTRVNNPGGGSETVNTTGLPVARGTMVVAGQSFTISGTDIINFVELGTLNAGTLTDVTASNGLTATDIGTTTNISMDTTGVTADSYGSATAVPVITVNDRGQITAATTANIAANTNTEYAISVEQTGGNNTDPNLSLTGTDASTDNVQFEGGTNVTVTRVDANRISISALAGGDIGTITEVSTSDGLTGGGTSGSVNVAIDDNGVTFARMQDIDANTIMGRNTAGSGDPTALTVAQTQTLLQITPNATTNTGTVTSVAGNNGLTGTVTTSGNIGIADQGVTTARIADNAVNALQLNVTGNGTTGQALTSDGDGTFSWGGPYMPLDISTLTELPA